MFGERDEQIQLEKMHALGFSPICFLLAVWLARKHTAFWSPDPRLHLGSAVQSQLQQEKGHYNLVKTVF